MMKAVSLLCCLASTSALRLPPMPVLSPKLSMYDKVEEIMVMNPDHDEPMPEMKFFKDMTDTSTSPLYSGEHLCRKSMWDKTKALAKTKPVVVVNQENFASGSFLEQLPKSGGVVFVLDDAFHSTCKSAHPNKYLDDRRVLAVGAENWAGGHHAKVTPLPIGMESSLLVGKYGDEALKTFLDLIEKPVPKKERQHNVNSDAHLHSFTNPKSGEGGDRVAMKKEVERAAIDDWYTHKVMYRDHFRDHVAQSQLSLCPEGNGMDTHRFYHNYALRTRCIVRQGKLSKLHSQFPGTVVVKSWKDVNQQNIQKWMEEPESKYDANLVKSDYWINKVLAKMPTH